MIDDELRTRVRNVQLSAFTLIMCCEDLQREAVRYRMRWAQQVDQVVRYAKALQDTIDALAKRTGVV